MKERDGFDMQGTTWMRSTLSPDKASRFPLTSQLRSVLFTVATMLGEVEVTLSLLESATIIHQ